MKSTRWPVLYYTGDPNDESSKVNSGSLCLYSDGTYSVETNKGETVTLETIEDIQP